MDIKFPFELNNYLFTRSLGRGAFSQVFEVTSIKYNQTFAAKVSLLEEKAIDEDGSLCDFELVALLNIDNAYVIRVYDYFMIHNHLVLILEYCSGGTVADQLANGKIYDIETIKKMGLCLLDALGYCHSRSLAHRDIKPSNVFIDQYGRYKLADFNLSSVQKPQELVNTRCGSLPFLAPETLFDSAYDPYKADIWAFGVLLYQAHSGQLPWTDEEILSKQRKEIVYPAGYDFQLRRLTDKILRHDPQQRPTISDIQQDPLFYRPKSLPNPKRIISGSNLIGRNSYNNNLPKPPLQSMNVPSFIELTSQRNNLPKGRTRRNSLNSARKTFIGFD